MNEYIIKDTTLKGIADAIRAKTGNTDDIPVPDMRSQIDSIPSGGDDETLKSLIDRSITSVEIPSGITTIGWGAFQSCTKLKTVVIPKGIQKFDTISFSGCNSLETVDLPNTLLEIWNNAFSGCSKIASLIIPANLNSLYYGAFQNCTGLTCITFKGTPKLVATTVFNNCTNLTTINVPWAEGEVANAPWGATNATINYNYTEVTENAD